MYFRALDQGPALTRKIANFVASAALALVVFLPLLAVGIRLL